jgi:hypothetical protein
VDGPVAGINKEAVNLAHQCHLDRSDRPW